MSKDIQQKKRVALVYGTVPTVHEIDQFQLIQDEVELNVISSESICNYFRSNSFFNDLTCIAVADHDENTTFLPGLEHLLKDYDLVIVKERLGVYAYQAVKAKWKHRFRLLVWIDNLTAFPGEDIEQMRAVREELTNVADGFIVQTQAAKSVLELEGVASEKIYQLQPWIDKRVDITSKNRAIARERLNIAESCKVITHFGQIEWEEGLLDLVHSLKIAHEKTPGLKDKLKLIFYGFGGLASELRQRCIKLGIDQDVFFVSPDRIKNDLVIAASDAFYLSSFPSRDRSEGDPYSIITAMTYNIPVICSRTSLSEEFVGKHRFDFCMGNPQSLAKAITKGVTARPLIKDIVAKNSTKVSKQFDAKQVKDTMQSILATISRKSPKVDLGSLDHRVLEVESKVANKQYLDAIDLVESIFKIKEIPEHHKSNLYRLIGDCFTKLGDPDAGKNAYLQAAELDPYSAKAYIGIGTVSLTKNRHDIAVIHFQKAVGLAPNDSMAILGLGLAFQGLEEWKEANKWVVKALNIEPENTAAIYTLVKLAYDRDDYSDAERILRKYCHDHPHDHNMIYTLGGILYKTGHYVDVLNYMDAILKLDPSDSRAEMLIKQAKRALERNPATAG